MSFIIGPDETEEQFEKRMASAEIQSPIEVFGHFPDWIPISYSNKSLAFWEGGCAWIEGTQVRLQLRKSLEKRDHYLGLVSKNELLKHEAVHALRVAFDEPRFEEMLAYQTSPSKWRRLFGPLFRNPRESLLILLLPLTWFFPIIGFGFLGLFVFAFLRLAITYRTFIKAKKNINQITQNPLGLMLYLTDEEISLFSKINHDEILEFIRAKQGYRWMQIRDFASI